VVDLHRAHVGSLNASIVHPREVMQCARPDTKEDIEVTRRLAESGKIIGVDVLDHVIVTHTGKHFSLKEKGYL
jgi:DNA repair protein RadC